MPTAAEREKKQLEEIAHLFLSGRCEERKTRPPPVQNPPAVPAGSAAPRTACPTPFWIRPRAALGHEHWVEFFLLNLALLFQIADEPVVWIPSCRPGWSGSERALPTPFKARLAGLATAGLPLSYCGPMGLRVFPSPLGVTSRQELESIGPSSGGGIQSLAGYRYVLAGEPCGPLPWESLPCLEVWLVGVPLAGPGAAVEERKGSEGRFRRRSAFVLLGAADEREARAVGKQWKEAQGQTVWGGGEPEYLGFVPGPFPTQAPWGRQWMIVLESPLGWQTRRLQEIASKIRARRPLEPAAPHAPA